MNFASASPCASRAVADLAPAAHSSPAGCSFGTRCSPAPAPVALPDSSALDLTLRALRPLLSRPEVTELCINTPHEAFIETGSGWDCLTLPFADFDWCRRLAKLVANSTRQRVAEETPLLSAALPSGERIQIVLPPATTARAVPDVAAGATDTPPVKVEVPVTVSFWAFWKNAEESLPSSWLLVRAEGTEPIW